MHPHLSLLIFTAFSAISLPPGSASILQSTSPPSSALATAGTASISSNPRTKALFPRAPEQQGDTPFARCSCRSALGFWWDCYIYQILNWPMEQKVTTRLHDELVKCGTLFFGLHRYYTFRRGKVGWAPLPSFGYSLHTGVVCSHSHSNEDDPPPWWESMNRQQGHGYTHPPNDLTWSVDEPYTHRMPTV